MCFCVCHCLAYLVLFLFFFFNDTATTEIYPLSLHDALPISRARRPPPPAPAPRRDRRRPWQRASRGSAASSRSEEHTSELQSQSNLVCRLLLEKKKKNHCHREYIRTGLTYSKSCL